MGLIKLYGIKDKFTFMSIEQLDYKHPEFRYVIINKNQGVSV